MKWSLLCELCGTLTVHDVPNLSSHSVHKLNNQLELDKLVYHIHAHTLERMQSLFMSIKLIILVHKQRKEHSKHCVGFYIGI